MTPASGTTAAGTPDLDTPALDATALHATEQAGQAYGRRAGEYIDLLGNVDAMASADRAFIGAWADERKGGRVLDVGCGPGHWAHWLRGRGVDVAGIDPTAEFVRHAQARYRDVDFSIGRGEALDADDASLSGILAWYSLIHTPPEQLGVVLAEFARCVEPGGGLLIGFFEGPDLAAFDHAVTTAYFWPLESLVRTVEDAGFTVAVRETRTDPGHRKHGAIAATRNP